MKFSWNSVNSVLLDVSSVILDSFKYPPIASIAFVIPSSVDTVFFSISCKEKSIAIGAVPVAILNAVFPAVLATVIQLMFFQSLSKTPFAVSLSFSLAVNSETIALINAILESSKP